MLPLVNHFVILVEAFALKSIGTQKAQKIFLFLSGMQMFFLLALRGKDVGTDTPAYLSDIKNIAEGATVGFEIGDVWLIRAFFYLTNDAQAVIAAYALLTILIMFFAIWKLSNDVYLSVIIYGGLLYYNFAFSGIRQALAMSIVFMAYSYLMNNRYIKSLLLIVCSFFIHQSAILSLLAIFIIFCLQNVFKVKSAVMVFFFCLMLYFFLFFGTNWLILIGTMFLTEYSWYINGYIMEDVSYTNLLFYFLVFLLCGGIIKKHYMPLDKRNRLIKEIVLLGIGVAAYVMATEFRLLNRLTLYFTCISIVLIPETICLLNNRKNRTMMYFLCVMLVTGYFITLVIVRSNNMVPYSFFWE